MNAQRTRRPRGLTLLEAVIALAMLAVVASLALPNFGVAAERARLKSAAETLAADLAEARLEAAKRGSALHVEFRSAGPAWCWSVATARDCGCGAPAACQLKTVQGRDHAGIAIVQSASLALEPSGAAGGTGAGHPTVFRSSRGEMLKVQLSPLGRASVCAVGGGVPGYPAC